MYIWGIINVFIRIVVWFIKYNSGDKNISVSRHKLPPKLCVKSTFHKYPSEFTFILLPR